MNIEHTINLFSRHEQLLFSQSNNAGKVVPCVIITGFLGSGKTTVVNHLLASQSTLRLAVLVNEVGSVDIDSQLLNAKQANAAVGTASRTLAGGCACCEVIGDLQSAVKQLCTSTSTIDYMVLETSGAAEVEPLVDIINSSGLRVEGVVAVVDAEEAAAQLQHPVALKQLNSADLVVLNKCDLANLGQIADAEDLIRKICPHVKLIRCRHGQVPPEMFFDTSPDDPLAEVHTGSSTTNGPPDTQTGFMSHESAPAMQRRGGAPGTTGALRRFREQKEHGKAGTDAGAVGQPDTHGKMQSRPDSSHPQDKDHSHGRHHQHRHSHGHSHDHAQISTRGFISDKPLQLASFQDFVVNHLLPAQGLLRTKGVLWFQESPRQRYVLQISGRRRVECCSQQQWQGPPGCQLVLIGQDGEVLSQLLEMLQQLQADIPGTPSQANLSEGACANAAHLRSLISQHPRFLVLHDNKDTEQSAEVPLSTSSDASSHSVLVEFTVEGAPLHGVEAEAVNFSVAAAVNAAGQVLVSSQAAAQLINATSLQQTTCRLATLQVAVSRDTHVQELWRVIDQRAAPVLRKAFAHIRHCVCDAHGVVLAN